MSSKNTSYNSDLKGARLISAEDAWIRSKNGKYRLNSEYRFVGKVDLNMPGMVLSTVQGKKPTFKHDISDLNDTAKRQIVSHFYDNNGKRNQKKVAYLGKKRFVKK